MKQCKHHFVHVTLGNWINGIIKVYCEKCGIDADDLHRKSLFTHLRRGAGQ